MPWTQLYVTGLSQTIEPSDEELERMLEVAYNLSSSSDECCSTNNAVLWAGPGSTLVKRDKHTGACRGYAFLAFFSPQGAEIVLERINNKSVSLDPTDDDSSPTKAELPQLRAELSKPKEKPKKKEASAGTNYSDLRLRRKRGAPVRKHPVIVSSDKTKTGLGNKTK